MKPEKSLEIEQFGKVGVQATADRPLFFTCSTRCLMSTHYPFLKLAPARELLRVARTVSSTLSQSDLFRRVSGILK